MRHWLRYGRVNRAGRKGLVIKFIWTPYNNKINKSSQPAHIRGIASYSWLAGWMADLPQEASSQKRHCQMPKKGFEKSKHSRPLPPQNLLEQMIITQAEKSKNNNINKYYNKINAIIDRSPYVRFNLALFGTKHTTTTRAGQYKMNDVTNTKPANE